MKNANLFLYALLWLARLVLIMVAIAILASKTPERADSFVLWAIFMSVAMREIEQ